MQLQKKAEWSDLKIGSDYKPDRVAHLYRTSSVRNYLPPASKMLWFKFYSIISLHRGKWYIKLFLSRGVIPNKVISYWPRYYYYRVQETVSAKIIATFTMPSFQLLGAVTP